MLNGETTTLVSGESEARSLTSRLGALEREAFLASGSTLAAELAEVMRKQPVRRPPSPSAEADGAAAAEVEVPVTTRLAQPPPAEVEPAVTVPDAQARPPARQPWREEIARAAAERGSLRGMIERAVDDDLADELAVADDALPPQAAAWVRKARRQRTLQALRDAGSWALSAIVATAILAVAAWALLGWRTDIEALDGAIRAIGLG